MRVKKGLEEILDFKVGKRPDPKKKKRPRRRRIRRRIGGR